jgi:hypothetical protein
MSKSLKDLLGHLVPSQEEWKVRLLNEWSTIMGDLRSHVQLERILPDATLILSTTNACWMQELYYLSDIILQKINGTLDKPYVKKLRFKQGTTYKRALKGTPQVTKTTKRTKPILQKELQALENITDPQLRDALYTFLIRCKTE